MSSWWNFNAMQIFAFIIFASNELFALSNVEKCIIKSVEISDKLKCLPGVTIVSEQNAVDRKTFDLQFTQPVDHKNPQGQTFKQLVHLIHINDSSPMIMHTSGYAIFQKAYSRLAKTFNANQIQVEHRYFASSRPSPADWSFLTVKQSADDFHVITSKLRLVYRGRWLNTGESKGGMTSVFFRYFYPDDLDGTLATVAPISFSLQDKRYDEFVNSVGGEAYEECRAKLLDFQMIAFKRREMILDRFGGKYSIIGSKEVAFEHSLIEAPFVFWQYHGPKSMLTNCSTIPTERSSDDTVYDFFRSLAPFLPEDQELLPFVPYYYQTLNELGSPDTDLTPIKNFLKHPYSVDMYIPKSIAIPKYSNETMHNIAQWTKKKAQRIMFVYGEFDPWTAGAFPYNKNEDGDSYRYIVKKGNHGDNVLTLDSEQRAEALKVLSRWLEQKPTSLKQKGAHPERFLEDILAEKRRLGQIPR